MEKVCKVCKDSKEVSEFHKQPNGKHGVKSKCKSCYSDEYKIKNPPKNVDVEGEKVCTTCKESMELSSFYKQRNGKYGVKSTCILCEKAYNKIRVKTPEEKERNRINSIEYRKNNPKRTKEINNKSRNKHKDKINATRRYKYANDEEFRKLVVERELKYKASGRRLEVNSTPEQREKSRARKKRYHSENRELENKKSLEYKRNNPEKHKEYNKRHHEELIDSKIIAMIRVGSNIDKEDITQEMIETRRLTIKLKRELQIIKNN